ncbi:class E sortase [Streptomyces sp. TRM 70361]|uniref:class E sortase n=1 Tax=Streptomyces sp. TRM 70361 TaxID=3116553 RepID=UPI002E7AC09A|nr:class E sortase [Streptomyces sp. TRM 70361]MEE1939497.1 class E sortase [Streptomyces sp. TRM 70361]
MTALRPEGTRGERPPTGRHRAAADPYAGQDAFEAAVGRLADPLSDPLPGSPAASPGALPSDPPAGLTTGLTAGPVPGPGPGGRRTASTPRPSPAPHGRHGRPRTAPAAPAAEGGVPGDPGAPGVPGGALDDETVALRQVTLPAGPPSPGPPADETMTLRQVRDVPPARTGPAADAPSSGDVSAAEPAAAPPDGGRAARRRAQRARQESPMVVASRVLGELFITLGVVMLLFVSYQLWWTNVIADRQAGSETKKLEQQWQEGEKSDERDPGAFSAGQGFAIMHIPKLDVKVPIAEGTEEDGVLDRGMVGHYSEEPLKTAMPWDEQGNFAVAGHRNTHGEPFRYINKLDKGDPIVVETQDTYYIYEMTSRLDSTLPSNVGVIGPVPPESGFTEPGRYITLTTCTPEFTSKYRMIVWGRMVEERPRSEGKPDALVR